MVLGDGGKRWCKDLLLNECLRICCLRDVPTGRACSYL